jgi:DNA ligase-1
MKRFSQLFNELDSSTATTAKVDALRRYFAQAPDADAAWAVYFLAGGKPRQVVSGSVLRALACLRAGIDEWLFEECYQAVGDLAETIAHVLPPSPAPSDVPLATWVEERLLPLREMPPELQAERIAGCWDELDTSGRFLLTKLIGGGFRVGVSKLLVQRALAEGAGLDPKVVAQRMMGFTDKTARPDAAGYLALVSPDAPVAGTVSGQPYPFFLAHAIEALPDTFATKLGPPADWLVEWKYDGIRAQIVKRAGQVWVWSRGEELMTERFPEVVALAEALPDGTVLDGEILVWKEGCPAPFALLQQRIGRKSLTKKVLAEAPVTFMAYDVLEWEGADVRAWPQQRRREVLAGWASAHPANTPAASTAPTILVSPTIDAPTWHDLATRREESRERGVEGFMLKHREARYGTGRTKAEGTWWKWKIDPLSVDAILVYAQAGHGRRASVYTDYTFAVWSRPPRDPAEAQAALEAIAARQPPAPDALQLVPFAKAYSGLTDEEFREVDRIIRQTTIEKFGPVRSVTPTLMFELGFEGINRSTRHKSGIAVRFPRMLRIRHDKPLHEADSLQTLEVLLQGRPS